MDPEEKRVHIYFCSTGTTALKLAEKLRDRILKLSGHSLVAFGSLNTIHLDKTQPEDILLIVASTTGNGNLPAGGLSFEASWPSLRKQYCDKALNVSFAIFGVGDSAYASTFNAASKAIKAAFFGFGAKPLAGGLTLADVAMEPLPMSAFNRWWAGLLSAFNGGAGVTERPVDRFVDQEHMLRNLHQGCLLSKEEPSSTSKILLVQIDLQGATYHEMEHIRILPSNSPAKV